MRRLETIVDHLGSLGTVAVISGDEDSASASLILTVKHTYVVFVDESGVLLTDGDLNTLHSSPEYISPVHAALLVQQAVALMESTHVD